jgi:hypothetical protein
LNLATHSLASKTIPQIPKTHALSTVWAHRAINAGVFLWWNALPAGLAKPLTHTN